MKLINSIESNYYFEDSNGNEIIITSDSESQAIETSILIENTPAPDPVESLKTSLINRAKSSAKEYLDKTDYLVIRHLEQRELAVATTLTEEEYTALLTKRNKARIDSNSEETLIESKTTITDLEKVKIARKG